MNIKKMKQIIAEAFERERKAEAKKATRQHCFFISYFPIGQKIGSIGQAYAYSTPISNNSIGHSIGQNMIK